MDDENTVREVKALYDALLGARAGLRVVVDVIDSGEKFSPALLNSLREQYCGKEIFPLTELEVVKRSRKQFDDIAIENSNLRREVEYLMNHIKVAREERDELIRAAKKA